MSTLFSISDAEFDDLEDEEFLIEACTGNFGTNQSRNNCLDANLRKTGHNISTNGQNLSDKNNKLNFVNRSASSTGICNISINSPAKLRPSPANSKILNDGYDLKNGKRQEHMQCASEPPSKRPTSFTKENTSLTLKQKFSSVVNEGNKESLLDKVSTHNHRCQKELKSLESCFLLGASSRSIQDTCTLSDGLRYMQNTKTVDSSHSNLSKGQSKNIETRLQGLCDYKSNAKVHVKTNSTKAPHSCITPTFKCGTPTCTSLQYGGNEYLQTDLPPNILHRNTGITLPSGNKSDHGASSLRQSPNQVASNKKTLDGKCSTPKTRRFPGPAGILPRLEPGQKLESLSSPRAETPKKNSPEVCQMVIHDADDDEFTMETWTVMQDEIQKRFSAPFDSLALVVKKAASQQLDKGKVAFLGVLVKTFCPTGLDVSVVLKDPSGEMQGTLHRKVLEEHQIEIGPGCGLLLKQVSVFSPSPRKHYLNITPGNIVEIFPACGERLSDSRKISQDTPKSQSRQMSTSRPELIMQEKTTQDSNLCEENFDDLLEGLEADEDILVEAMNF